jgi:hypothetical protein
MLLNNRRIIAPHPSPAWVPPDISRLSPPHSGKF